MNKSDELEEWLEGRPDAIKQMARKYPPWNEYKIKSTGQTCHLVSYAEEGTVRVNITSFTLENLFGAERQVLGISIDDLELVLEELDHG